MTIDISKLPGAELARHLGNPTGEVGVAVGQRLNRTNGNITTETYRRLGLGAGMAVLEIGPANGRLLPELLGLAPGLRYTGIDISATMVEEARSFNAAVVAAGQARFEVASAARIPLGDGAVDRVFAINVIYFWPDAVAPLREIRRVLRSSGYSVIAAATPDTVAGNPVYTEENGFHVRDAETLVRLHREAGFGDVSVERVSDPTTSPDGTPWMRYYNLVIARP